ncbi:MAG: hypothetical protein HGA65_19505 [Oscillochloris sp.]|nr:hypothetical protein [Oscillochloris sp.]
MIPLTREAGVPPVPMLPALHLTQPLTYLSGGSQTDVYCTADRRYVLKLKSVERRTGRAQQRAAQLKQLADAVYAHFGPEHSLRTWFLVLADAMGQPLVVGVQPFLAGARPLDAIAIDGLTLDSQTMLLAQLHTIIARSLACYRRTGRVADLYGYGRKAGAEARRWELRRLLAEGWRLLAQCPLLSAII